MFTETILLATTLSSNVSLGTSLQEEMSADFDTATYDQIVTSTAWFDPLSTGNQSAPVTFVPTTEVSEELFIAEADVKRFSFVSRSFVNPIVCLLGFIGNSLGAGVLWRQAKQQKLSIFWYLCALTITDNVFLGLGVIDGIARVVQAFDMALAKYLIAHFRLGLAYLDNTSLHSARFIVVVMSCERLVSVAKPLHVKDTWFAKYPIRLILACILFNVLFGLPIIINSTVVTKHVGNRTEYIFTFKNYDKFMAHFWVVEATVHSFLPTTLLIFINLAIPLQLYRSAKHLRSTLKKDASSQQGKVTATVMTITIMYVFLSVPLIVVKILQYVNPDFNTSGKYRLYFWFMADMGRCLGYFNAANDFPIYFLVSNNYRAVFKAMYCKRFTHKSKMHRGSTIVKTTGSRDTMTMSISG